ncbi:MAG TPA: response regulator [Fimbriimonadaceae bacterium]|nr:response regulator [Fimbriimonadaceae bacterium]
MPRNRVLFVDDEPNILAAFARQLRREVDLVTACGPEPGLEALASDFQFSVIVVDMQMPGMDGIEFLRRAESLQPNAVRIMLTGNADSETAERAMSEVSIFRFLRKPCSADELMDAIVAAGVEHKARAA